MSPPTKSSSSSSVLWNFLPGAAHAATTIAIGYPFDTLKTRLQTGMYIHQSTGAAISSTTTVGCNAAATAAGGTSAIAPVGGGFYVGNIVRLLRQSVRHEGLLFLYKGCAVPITSLLLKRPMEFFVYETLNDSRPGSYFTNGALSAVGGSLLGCPFNIVKIRVQNSTSLTIPAALREVSRQRPFCLGFFQGLPLQLAFSVPSAGIYLGLYGKLREALLVENDGLVKSRGVAGGLAGVCSSLLMWSLLMPIDTLRTHVQAQRGTIAGAEGAEGVSAGEGVRAAASTTSTTSGAATSTSAPSSSSASSSTTTSSSASSSSASSRSEQNRTSQSRGRSFWERSRAIDSAQTIYRTRGVRGFWVGLVPMYCRAFAITAPAMYAYEATRAWVNAVPG
ncbi:unnamed protein product [Amoebophrya sp. A25]|nr:unnamed protein product [Amoebophrya sp. A25]|eukprot:GSA25T00006422001.1